MAQDTQEHSAVGANQDVGDNAGPAGIRPYLPTRAGLVVATLFYLLTLIPTRLDVLLRSWPDVMLPIARIELFFPTTYAHLIALSVMALTVTLYVRARFKAIRRHPELVRSDRGISHAGPLSREHLSLGWSIAWPLQLFALLVRHTFLFLGVPSSAYAVLGPVLLLAPMALAVVLSRRSLRRRHDISTTGLAWPFLWRFALVVLVTGVLRYGVATAICTGLGTSELPLLLWGGIWALQVLAESFGFGWAAHQAALVRDRAGRIVGQHP